MKSFAACVVLALVSNGVIAGEVGALDPKISKALLNIDVAIAEIGTSERWETRLDNYAVPENASTRQMKELAAHLDSINATIHSEMSELIEAKLEKSLSY